jgi:hypothetical protein
LNEIGERLHVTRNTVKTQAIGIYRKFGVSSRRAAISRMYELGCSPGSSSLEPIGQAEVRRVGAGAEAAAAAACSAAKALDSAFAV